MIQEGSSSWVSTSLGNKGPESVSLQMLEAPENDEERTATVNVTELTHEIIDISEMEINGLHS